MGERGKKSGLADAVRVPVEKHKAQCDSQMTQAPAEHHYRCSLPGLAGFEGQHHLGSGYHTALFLARLKIYPLGLDLSMKSPLQPVKYLSLLSILFSQKYLHFTEFSSS
jgi:hypothetical protein